MKRRDQIADLSSWFEFQRIFRVAEPVVEARFDGGVIEPQVPAPYQPDRVITKEMWHDGERYTSRETVTMAGFNTAVADAVFCFAPRWDA